MTRPNPPWRWRRSRRNLDAATLPAEVRQKLGWLLLDHLRVCSIGARLPWSDWSRRYVGLVGKAGASHVLFSPETVNPQHATFLNVTFGSSFDADDTHVGAMLHPGVAAWSAALAVAEHTGASGPEVLAAVVAGYETIIRIGLAVQPSHFKRGFQSTGTCDGFGTAAAAGRLLFRGADRRAKDRRRAGPCRRLRQRPGAVLLFRRIGQAHPRRARGRGRRRRGAARGGGLQRAERHHRRAGRLCPRLCRRLRIPALIEEGLGQRFHLMDVLVKSHAAAARVAAGIDAMLELRQQHKFAIGDIASMALGIPKIIQGRLTNPHPVDLQAAQMCLPFSVALASKIALAPGQIATLGIADFEAGPQGSKPARTRGAHDDCAGRRGGGREQRAFHGGARQRDAARRPHAFQARAGAQGQPVPALHRRGARGAVHAGAVEPRAARRSAPRSWRCRAISTGSIRAGSGGC